MSAGIPVFQFGENRIALFNSVSVMSRSIKRTGFMTEFRLMKFVSG